MRDTAALLYGPYVLAALTEEKDGLHFSVDGISFVPLFSIDKEKYQVYVKVPGKFEKMMGKTK